MNSYLYFELSPAAIAVALAQNCRKTSLRTLKKLLFSLQKTRETAMVYDTCNFTSFFAEITSLKSTFRGSMKLLTHGNYK